MKYTILNPVDKLFDEALRVRQKPTLVITDTHAPYQNAELLHKAFDMARDVGVKQLIHVGDLIDAASYNSQAKGELVTPIETDIEHARSILYTAQQYFSLILMPGNHDMYYIRKEKLTFKAFIEDVVLLNKYTRKVITTEYDYVFYGNYAIIGHPSAYEMIAGKLAAGLAQKYNMHALIGHDHIRGSQRSENGKWGISIGGMFTPHSFWYKEKSYTLFPESQLGFVIIRDGKIYHYDNELRETIYE